MLAGHVCGWVHSGSHPEEQTKTAIGSPGPYQTNPGDMNEIQQCQEDKESSPEPLLLRLSPLSTKPLLPSPSDVRMSSRNGGGPLSPSCPCVPEPVEFFMEALFSWISLHLSFAISIWRSLFDLCSFTGPHLVSSAVQPCCLPVPDTIIIITPESKALEIAT